MDVKQLPDLVHEAPVNGGSGPAVVKGSAIVRRYGEGETVGLPIPASELMPFTVVAILAGVAAAVVPARRAARLNVARRPPLRVT